MFADVECHILNLNTIQFSNDNLDSDFVNYFKQNRITSLEELLKLSSHSTSVVSHVAPTNSISGIWKKMEGSDVVFKREYYIMKELVPFNIWIKFEEQDGKWTLVIKSVKTEESNLAIDRKQKEWPIDIDSVAVYARFLTRRKVFVPVDENIKAKIYWDNAVFLDSSEYSLFSIVGEVEGIEINPKRSKVVECIYREDNLLYKQLVESEIVKDVEYSTEDKFIPGKDPGYDKWISDETVNKFVLGKPEWNDKQVKAYISSFRELSSAEKLFQ
eukprot:NODE_42_length_29671_cov_0.584810.p8 type:complete len:272 gc:universal NODE_42_length_29671_cov_0.584810:26323-25508(-)